MSEWKEYKLGDIITLNYGKALKEQDRKCGNIPVYSSAGVTGYHNEAMIKSKGIIVGRKGTIGKIYLSKIPFCCIDTAFYILPKEDLYNFTFLFYLLQTLGLEELNSDSAVPGLNRDTAYLQEISLPPINEQSAIAEVLSSLDDKIDLLHRQNKTLEQIAETLFRQWFVEEAEERWEESKLSDLLTITSSKRIYYSEYVSSGIPFYRSKEIIELHHTGSTNSELFISLERFQDIEKKFGAPVKGDILMTSVGTLGVTYIVKEEDKFYFKDGNLTWFKDFKGISSAIIYLWLNSRIGQEELRAITIGSTQEALTIIGLKNLSIKFPPNDKLIFYEREFKLIINKIESNQNQIRTLTQLRYTLLPRLMSGEVRVKI